LNKPQTEEARRSIRPAYHGLPLKLQHCQFMSSERSQICHLSFTVDLFGFDMITTGVMLRKDSLSLKEPQLITSV
jgi:hypothetical protein